MADYAPNYTARIKLVMLAGGHPHSQTWRIEGVPDVTAVDAAISDIETYYTAVEAALYDDTAVTSIQFAQRDSDIFLPVPATITVSGAVAASGRPRYDETAAWSFVGRTTGGLRMILYQYGVSSGSSFEGDSNFRQTSGENVSVSNGVAALNGFTWLVGNDGIVGSWYPYANMKYNDHWLRATR
jgi:hypothetical protein